MDWRTNDQKISAGLSALALCAAGPERPAFLGVSNGTRTRDILDHNQVLYQLSYTHHAPLGLAQLSGSAADSRNQWSSAATASPVSDP